MTTKEATREIRRLLGSRIFGATFEKSDGSIRTGSFRLGVRKEVDGAGISYDPASVGNLIVFDMRLGAYRTIRLESVRSLRVRGRTINLGS